MIAPLASDVPSLRPHRLQGNFEGERADDDPNRTAVSRSIARRREISIDGERASKPIVAAMAQAQPSPAGLLMPHQSLLYTCRITLAQPAPDGAHRPRIMRGLNLRGPERG